MYCRGLSRRSHLHWCRGCTQRLNTGWKTSFHQWWRPRCHWPASLNVQRVDTSHSNAPTMHTLHTINYYYYYFFYYFLFFTLGSKIPRVKSSKKLKSKAGVARLHLNRPGTHGQRKSLETERSWSVVWWLQYAGRDTTLPVNPSRPGWLCGPNPGRRKLQKSS